MSEEIRKAVFADGKRLLWGVGGEGREERGVGVRLVEKIQGGVRWVGEFDGVGWQ